MRAVSRAVLAVAVVSFAAGTALMFWPLHANGLVGGNALWPHYARGFYVSLSSYSPLPAHPSRAALRHAGVVFPQDVVADRRALAAVVLAAGVVLAAAGVAVRRARAGRRPASGR